MRVWFFVGLPWPIAIPVFFFELVIKLMIFVVWGMVLAVVGITRLITTAASNRSIGP